MTLCYRLLRFRQTSSLVTLPRTQSTLLGRQVAFSTSSDDSNEAKKDPSPKSATVYVHPLSQIVLMHLQSACHDWIMKQGLDRALTIQRDGTFVLEYRDGLSRIWTHYDPADKKHWLLYDGSGGQIHHRFLLQDNLLPVWNGKKKSLPERIHQSVEDMIQAINELE